VWSKSNFELGKTTTYQYPGKKVISGLHHVVADILKCTIKLDTTFSERKLTESTDGLLPELNHRC